MGNLINDALRNMSYFFDTIIYGLIKVLFDLFILISKTDFFKNETFTSFTTRIYVFIGMYMLFRMALVIINYVVNPDQLMKGDKNAGKLISRVIISLVLLISVNFIFNLAYEFQKIVTTENIIGKFILGKNPGDTTQQITPASIGDKMAGQAFHAFFQKNCDTAPDVGNTESLASAKRYITDRRCSDSSNNNEETYSYDYKIFISTIAGVVICWLLLNYCLELAIRVIKLGLLQLLAPIPIISYVDPNSEKSGAFKNWVSACTTVYLDIFIRLIIMFFIIYLMQEIPSIQDFKQINPNASSSANAFLFVLIFIGLILFAKQAPELIKDLFGIKGSKWGGKFEGGLLKNLATGGAIGAGIAGGMGLVGGAMLGSTGGALTGLRNGGFGGMIRGAGLGALKGADAGKSAGSSGKGFGSTFGIGKQSTFQKITGDPQAKAGIFGGRSFMQSWTKSAGKSVGAGYTNHINSKIDSSLRKQYGENYSDMHASAYNSNLYNQYKGNYKNDYNKDYKDSYHDVQNSQFAYDAYNKFGGDTAEYNNALREEAERITQERFNSNLSNDKRYYDKESADEYARNQMIEMTTNKYDSENYNKEIEDLLSNKNDYQKNIDKANKRSDIEALFRDMGIDGGKSAGGDKKGGK